MRREMKAAGDKAEPNERHPCKRKEPLQIVRELLSHFHADNRPAFVAEKDQDPKQLHNAPKQLGRVIETLTTRASQLAEGSEFAKGEERLQVLSSIEFTNMIASALRKLTPSLDAWISLQVRKTRVTKLEADLAASRSECEEASQNPEESTEVQIAVEALEAAKARVVAESKVANAAHIDFLVDTMDHMERASISRERKLHTQQKRPPKKVSPAQMVLNDKLLEKILAMTSPGGLLDGHSIVKVITVSMCPTTDVMLYTKRLKCEACGTLFLQVVKETVLAHCLGRKRVGEPTRDPYQFSAHSRNLRSWAENNAAAELLVVHPGPPPQIIQGELADLDGTFSTLLEDTILVRYCLSDPVEPPTVFVPILPGNTSIDVHKYRMEVVRIKVLTMDRF